MDVLCSGQRELCICDALCGLGTMAASPWIMQVYTDLMMYRIPAISNVNNGWVFYSAESSLGLVTLAVLLEQWCIHLQNMCPFVKAPVASGSDWSDVCSPSCGSTLGTPLFGDNIIVLCLGTPLFGNIIVLCLGTPLFGNNIIVLCLGIPLFGNNISLSHV